MQLSNGTGVPFDCSYTETVNLKGTSACAIGSAAFLALASCSFANANAAGPPQVGAGDSSTVSGSSSDNPYAIITDRNVFRLNPIPPPSAAPEPKPADLPKINLNGFVKIRDITRVLFSIPPKDAKQQITYYSLAPGEKQGILELVKINSAKGEVDILNSGTAMTLSLASNSLASKGGGGGPAPGPGFGGMHRMPNVPAPTPPPSSPVAASAIVVGGNEGGSGGVTVAGGSSASTPSGGNSPFNTSSSGVTVAGGATSGGNSSGVQNQIASALFSGQQPNTQIGNPVTEPTSPDIQAANLLLHHTQYGANSPPLPPPLAALVGEGQPANAGPPPVP
jgi:hypothetical protein